VTYVAWDTRSRGGLNRPTYQWEGARGGSMHALHLYGPLGQRELSRVVDSMIETGGSPRDFVCVDFEDVDHLDYRALPEFASALQRLRERGASVWLVGLSPYLRALFHVAGQGPALSRLEWRSELITSGSFVRRAEDFRIGIQKAGREEAWHKTGF
jgi:ABC-type transporter Mla MlaB component